MACPFCEGAEEHTGKYQVHSVEYPYVEIDYECQCLECEKIFWQRQYFETDDYDYKNLEDAGEMTEYLCPHCGANVCKNNLYDPEAEEGIESYPYICIGCDENFYGIEVKGNE
jgi:hypothetical protein